MSSSSADSLRQNDVRRLYDGCCAECNDKLWTPERHLARLVPSTDRGRVLFHDRKGVQAALRRLDDATLVEHFELLCYDHWSMWVASEESDAPYMKVVPRRKKNPLDTMPWWAGYGWPGDHITGGETHESPARVEDGRDGSRWWTTTGGCAAGQS